MLSDSNTGIPIPMPFGYGLFDCLMQFIGAANALNTQCRDRSHDLLHMTTVDSLIISLDMEVFN